jgi:hypothetical protein
MGFYDVTVMTMEIYSKAEILENRHWNEISRGEWDLVE